MSDANSNAMSELERMLAENTTPQFAEQADRKAAEEATRQIEQARLLNETLIGPKPK